MEPSALNGATQPTEEDSASGSTPRICVATLRGLTKRAYRCGIFESEDVLSGVATVDFLEIERRWGDWVKDLFVRKLLWHDISKKLIFVNPGLRKTTIKKEYDMFVCIFQNFSDFPYLNAITGWRERCRTSICWIDEIYAASISGLENWLDILNQFDHVFIGSKGSISEMSRAIGKNCRWLPGGVDALRFSPFPHLPARVIDVYSIGRREPRIHSRLLDSALRGEVFYVYDTLNGSDTEVYDHRQHRDMFSNLAKRSRCFMVAPARADDALTRGQVEVGYRFYEGTAAGALLVGQEPNCDAFSTLFPWPQAVIPARQDGSDIVDILADIAANPERASVLSRRNAAEALLRFDWVYRWKEVFTASGFDPSPAMAAREHRLKQLAEVAGYVAEGYEQPSNA